MIRIQKRSKTACRSNCEKAKECVQSAVFANFQDQCEVIFSNRNRYKLIEIREEDGCSIKKLSRNKYGVCYLRIP